MGADLKQGKYIYCITELEQPQSFGPSVIGSPGSQLYAVCVGDIAAVVSDAPIKRYTLSRENTLAHEKAIEKVMAEHPVLPVRFATVAQDENKVKRILEKEHDRFRDLLNQFRARKELGLKAIFKEDVIYKDILQKYEHIRLLKEKVAVRDLQRAHYQRVEIGRMVEQALEKERESVRQDILNCLSPLAVEVRTNDTYGELMIINAAFLVERNKEGEFDLHVQKLCDRYGEKARFNYVGTVPPFNFVNLVIDTENY
jgi:hypothetical protein